MEIQKIIDIFEETIDYTKLLRPFVTKKNKEFNKGFISGKFRLFENLKLSCTDLDTLIKDPTDEDKKEFYYMTRDDINKIDIVWELIGILEYRNCRIPIYLDEYAQTYFMRYKGDDRSSGNFNALKDAIYEFTYIIDKDLLIKELEEFENVENK